MLLERGITIRKGRHYIEESLPAILEDLDNELSGALRVLLTQLRMEMQYLHGQIEETDKLIGRASAASLEQCRRLLSDPRNRADHSYGHASGSHRQRCSFQEGPQDFSAWLGVAARRTLYRWQAKS